MYQPITPVIPFEPTTHDRPVLRVLRVRRGRCLSQSSSTASILPSAIAWKFGWPSVMSVTFTLQPSFFSSTYLTT